LLAVSDAVVTTDTIPHASNRIAVAPLLAAAIRRQTQGNP
jgi:hypothetical protein